MTTKSCTARHCDYCNVNVVTVRIRDIFGKAVCTECKVKRPSDPYRETPKKEVYPTVDERPAYRCADFL